MKRSAPICMGLLCLMTVTSTVATAQQVAPGGNTGEGIYVTFEANTLPTEDPLGPWIQLGGQGAAATLASGVLTLCDYDAISGWLFYTRSEPALAAQPLMHYEARVGFVTNNGSFGEPGMDILAHNPSRPPDNFADVYFVVSLYSDHIDLRRHYPDATDYLLLSAQVPDFASSFHVIRVDSWQGSSLTFELYLDGALVGTVGSQPNEFSLNQVGFGPGLYQGASCSRWDYFRYWSDQPVGAEASTWGTVKSLYR